MVLGTEDQHVADEVQRLVLLIWRQVRQLRHQALQQRVENQVHHLELLLNGGFGHLFEEVQKRGRRSQVVARDHVLTSRHELLLQTARGQVDHELVRLDHHQVLHYAQCLQDATQILLAEYEKLSYLLHYVV